MNPRAPPSCVNRRGHGVFATSDARYELRARALEDHAHDLAEAQRHDRQVVAAQPQRRQADEVSRAGRDEAADEAGDQEEQIAGRQSRPVERALAGGPAQNAAAKRGVAEQPKRAVVGDGPGDVAAEGHEAGVADRELAGEAVHQRERDGQDDVDADVEQHLGPERPGERLHPEVQQQGHAQADEDGRGAARQDGPRRGARKGSRYLFDGFHQTFSTVAWPRMPAGRNSSTRINSENTYTSR